VVPGRRCGAWQAEPRIVNLSSSRIQKNRQKQAGRRWQAGGRQQKRQQAEAGGRQEKTVSR